ncbi:MAG: DNA translocase FtsK 4TM domain-containing protein [Mogibacterium sp.]|nr:DNA translocase FtsK 4TM domain-containing protein [Mogibacterium sp.]
MAQQSNSGEKKRGPGRPPGSKNKPKTNSGTTTRSKSSSSAQSGPTRQEVLAEMQRRSDRDRRNNDVIWSITFFALGLFLFFTVVMDTTGSFGMKVHDLCYGLFGVMAVVLPFLVFAYAILLLGGRVRHIGTGTAIFSILIYLNLCILNSYRFIDPENIRFGFSDIANYYMNGINGIMGGAVGMELGSILAKFFGLPGLLILSIAVLLISFFMVANTPISRFAGKMSTKVEEKRMIRELEKDEAGIAQGGPVKAASTADSSVSAAPPAKRSFLKSLLGIGDDDVNRESQGQSVPAASATDIPKPFGTMGNRTKSNADNIDYTKVMDSPVSGSQPQGVRSTLFGKLRGYIAGIDSETGEDVTGESLKSSEKAAAMGLSGSGRSSAPSYGESRDFEHEEEDYGYKGKRRVEPVKVKTGLGLGDPEEVGHSGSYGLDAHGGSGKPKAAAAAKAAAAEPAAAKSDTAKAAPAKKAAAEEPKVSAAEEAAEDAKIAAGFNAASDDSSYELPPVSLLKKDTGSKQTMSEMQLHERAELLEQTLNTFGVDAKVIKVTQGASVTRYEVQPATGVKVASITRLTDDLALNLRAKSIRIEAPIPGKAAVGIEVENDKPSPVLIRDLIDSDEFREASSVIEFVVGKDISGNNIVADLRDMPHMLIAGATGSGKSVCINSIITSFLYKARPSELKLIMIDPKVVELGNYNGIPHMLTPVVTDPRKASRALAIAVDEMDKRYELFAKNNVKDIESYNELMRSEQRYADVKPQIVIIIDELADLMMAAPSEVENSICRLAQKARAAGMHLIVATQRPSVDVVTGLIKANIPSRIAFSVASQFDSRTILDMAGAEKLLGKGDMLFSPVGSTKPYRVQGPFISEKETDRIIKFVKKEGGDADYDDEWSKSIESGEQKKGSEPQDELTEDAIAFIFKSKQASVSMLQRRFRIGYNRAARIIDEIEEKGIIGPSDGSRPRQLLMTEDEYYGGGADEAEEPQAAEPEPAAQPVSEPESEPVPEPEPVSEPVPVIKDVPTEPVEPAPADSGSVLSNTRAMDSFNSLPESVRRMVMDADSESDY